MHVFIVCKSGRRASYDNIEVYCVALLTTSLELLWFGLID